MLRHHFSPAQLVELLQVGLPAEGKVEQPLFRHLDPVVVEPAVDELEGEPLGVQQAVDELLVERKGHPLEAVERLLIVPPGILELAHAVQAERDVVHEGAAPVTAIFRRFPTHMKTLISNLKNAPPQRFSLVPGRVRDPTNESVLPRLKDCAETVAKLARSSGSPQKMRPKASKTSAPIPTPILFEGPYADRA